MNAQSKVAAPTVALLREPFAENHISKLPKPTKQQTEAVRADFKKGIRCKECGSWHHPDVVHLDYVGHAALTDRLLDTDLEWSWEPLAYTDLGLPAFDQSGGLWIKLTVLGVTRLGYGHAAAKLNADPGAREKEVIGDALRNAAMRFGAALDLWHKGDLHSSGEEASDGSTGDNSGERTASPGGSNLVSDADVAKIIQLCEAVGGNQAQLICEAAKVSAITELTVKQAPTILKRLEEKLAEKAKQGFGELIDDEIPY